MRNERERFLPRVGPPVLILVIGLVFLFRLWIGPGILYSKHSDIIALHASIKALEQRSFASAGKLPIWDPYTNCGNPAFANPHSIGLFPFQFVYYVLPLDRAINVTIVLNVIMAGLAMYVFSRRRLEHLVSALLCGVAYMLSYRYLAAVYAGWLSHLSMYALTPLLFWGCDRLLAYPNIRRSLVFGLVVALCLLQGSMQHLYYAAVGCGVFAVFHLLRGREPDRLRAVFCLAAGGLLGLMLSLPSLLPRLEAAGLSTRTQPNYSFFLASPPTVADLATLADPRDEGGSRDEFWENNFYFGLWLYPLGVLACLTRWRRGVPLLVAWTVVMFLCFDTPVLKFLFHWLPGFNLFRQSTRLLWLAQFVLVLLAATGLDGFLTDGAPARRARMLCLLALLTAGAGLVAARLLPAPPLYVISLLMVVWGLLLLSSRRAVQVVGMALLVLLPIVDAGLRMLPVLSPRPLSEALPGHPFHATLRAGAGNGRTAAIGRTAIPYGMGGYYDIPLANGYNALNLRHYAEYFAILQHGDPGAVPGQPVVWTDLAGVARPDMLRALDVTHVVTHVPLSLEAIGFDRIAGYEDVPVFVFYEGIINVPVYVYRSRDRLGAAYFARSATGVRDESASLQAIAEASSPLDAYVQGFDAGMAALDHRGGVVRLVRRGIDEYEYEIDSLGRSFLILSQIWYPGWVATLDEGPVTVYRTNHALIGCAIPPGRHYLKLTMTSPSRARGLMAAGAALIIMATLAALEPRKPRQPSVPVPSDDRHKEA